MYVTTHGGNGDILARLYGLDKTKLLDFSANINPLGVSAMAKKAIFDSFDSIMNYPDITNYELIKAISEYENIEESGILIGNGGAEVIFNIVRALQPRKALLFAPTFSEYLSALNAVGAEVKYHMLSAENNFRYDNGILKDITEDTDIIFICSPNNPSGNLADPSFYRAILEEAGKKSATLVIDESFIDFVEDSEKYTAKCLRREYKNLIVIKSATKFFAIPGLRIGYAYTSSEKIINDYEKIAVPWCINTFAKAAFIAASKDVDYIKATKDYIYEQKEILYKELCKINGIKVFYPTVNFILFKLEKSIDLYTEMLKQNILIRSCSNYVSLDESYYRVAVKTAEQNKRLVEILQEFLTAYSTL
jgi:threonine-phosphate decarboxylase